MKTALFFFGLLVTAALCVNAAPLVNTWQLDVPSQYVLSDPGDIEVSNGVARLKLQAVDRIDASLSTYLTNGTSQNLVALGPDVSVVLTKVGGLYRSRGVYTSRVLQGVPGNLWNGLHSKAYNLSLENAYGGISATASNIVALYHFNDEQGNPTWVDSVSGANATPVGGATFATRAKLGSNSAFVNSAGAGVATVNPTLLSGAQQLSYCLWVRLLAYQDNCGLLFERGSTINGLLQYRSGHVQVAVGLATVPSVAVLPLNEWAFVVATWDKASKTVQIYMNGKFDTSLVYPTFGDPFNQNDVFYVGLDKLGLASRGYFDEVAIFNRVLSADEITAMYTAGSAMRFQLRADVALDAMLADDFVGPGGLPDTYYYPGDQPLVLGGTFKHFGTYAQYRAYFAGPSDGAQTPFLDAVGLTGSRLSVFDSTLGDFSRGAFTQNTITVPTAGDTPYTGLAKQRNGGYNSSGTFTSEPIDAGQPALWDRLQWTVPDQLPSSSDLVGLWHLEGGWGDSSANGFNGQTVVNVSYTSMGKLGAQSAVFTGASYAVMGNLSPNVVKGIEFWIRDENPDDGIMDLANNASNKVYVAVSGHLITPVGFGNAVPALCVNGSSTSRRLIPGWNHVGITIDAGITPTEFTVGVANGVYMNGTMDELALYNRAVTPAEFKTHFVTGRRPSAGRVKFQVRAGDSLPLSGSFVGPNDLPNIAFLDNTGGSASLPGSTVNKRYIQYQATFEGGGDVTPTFGTVTLTTLAGQSFTDSAPEDFFAGTFSGTARVGDEAKLFELSSVPGLVNYNADVDVEGLWHMDEAQWGPTDPVQDSSFNPKSGSAFNGANTVAPGKVGTRCGLFDGVSGYVSLNGVSLAGDFSILLWFKSQASGRSAVLSRSDGNCTLELNGNGSAAAPGRMAFVVNSGAGAKIALGSVVGLNDGMWHHVAGVRRGQTIHIYIDGAPAGSASLGSATSLGSGGIYLARHASLGSYFGGNLDELIIFNRALSEGEIRQVAAMEYSITGTGTYDSEVFDAGRPAIWQTIAWREDAPYEQAQVPGDLSLVGLWHLDETSGVAVADSSGQNLNGLLSGAVSRGTGKFAGCLSFSGAGGQAQIPDSALLEPGNLSVEAWVNMNSVNGRTVVDKRNATQGYALATDADGKPYFWVSGTTIGSYFGLQPGRWYHLAGTYDGVSARLYVNGTLAATVALAAPNMAAGAMLFGQSYSGGASFDGLIDEVAVYSRVLGSEEVMDHARAGAGVLQLQGRSADDLTSLTNLPYVGPGGSSNLFFTTADGASMLGSVPLGQLFQYRAYLATEDGLRAPRFQGATIKQSGYPTDNPWVAPADGYGQPFLGKLLDFSQKMATNVDAAVKYQISGNNGTNWYWWNGTQWDDATAFGSGSVAWAFANFVSAVDTQLPSFYQQLYPATGGVFKFKAFLHSGGNDQVALDSVTLARAPGRLVITVPNGLEVGENAWLIGVPYQIQWTSTGVVGNNLRIEYSLDSGASWTTIASNRPNTGSYSYWTTPNVVTDHARVRITDQADAAIGDTSDSDFSLVQRFRVLVPNGGEKWYTGRTNVIRWASAVGLGNLVDLFYSSDGNTFTTKVFLGQANAPGGTNNSYAWSAPKGLPGLLSETAKIRVQTFGGTAGQDDSDDFFTLAGIEVTRPAAGALVNRRSTYTVNWVAAGAGPAVAMDYSFDGGGTWTNVVSSITNQPGVNNFDWTIVAQPTDNARVRVRSLSDTNVLGISASFVMADIDIISPVAGTNWAVGSTNNIQWIAGGAGPNVSLYYSTNSGGVWTPITASYTNQSGSNSFAWVVPPYPGPATRIKVQSNLDTNLLATSSDFNIAGVRILSPDGGEQWQLGQPNAVSWTYQSAGESCTLQFSYDGGLTYQTIGGPGVPLINRALGYTPVLPTVRAKAKIIADQITPWWPTNMFDESAAFFTVGGILVTIPSNGMVYTSGTTNNINWISAGANDPQSQARIYYTTTGTDSNLIAVVGNGEAYPGQNSYSWGLRSDVDPSAQARVVVRSGPYSGTSAVFTIRGIKFSLPNASSVYDIGGDTAPLVWKSAGLDETANGYFYLSTDGGQTFAPTAINAAQIWTVLAGAYPWVVDPATDPATNAVVRFVVTASASPVDVNFEARSQPFVLRGLKFKAPVAGTVWRHGGTNVIQWLAARAGAAATVYYAADGVNYDATPVASGVQLVDGANSYAWATEFTRMPSTNATLKVVSPIATAVSQPFTLRGIRVTSPIASDIWALGETNRTAWVSVGATPPYRVVLVKADGTQIPIASGVNNTFYDWIVTTNGVGSNDVMRVFDSSNFSGDSDPFRIVGEPTVQMLTPVAGDFWKVSQTYIISWSKGGKMTTDFHVMFSTAPYVATNDIFGVVTLTNGVFSIPWSVPDRLGPTRITVQHNTLPTVHDISPEFNVVGMFTMVYPNGGETNIYALKLATVNWFTRGSVSAVNLYYSTDPQHRSNTWTKINAAPVPNNGQGTNDILTTYDWVPPNLESATTRFRVQDANQPGAFDDSDADFPIQFFTIVWNVFDSSTSNQLDKLSVNDSVGWADSTLASPVTHKYPFGQFDTIWSRQFFFDKVVFNWSSEPSRTIFVAMDPSKVEPTYQVMSSFLYDAQTNKFMIQSWLERGGTIVQNPSSCTIHVFDKNGVEVATLVSAVTIEGVFWQQWNVPPTIDRTQIYFARVDVVYSGLIYSSGVTYNLRVPSAEEQAQTILAAISAGTSNVLGAVSTGTSNVLTGVSNVASQASALLAGQAVASAKLDVISNLTTSIQANIAGMTTNLSLLNTQALARLDALSNLVGAIAVSTTTTNNPTTLQSQLQAMAVELTRGLGRILTRPTQVKLGSTVAILYRTKIGLAPTIKVVDGAGVTRIDTAVMPPVGQTGIYEYDVTFAPGWALGDASVTCQDGTAIDTMIVKVTRLSLDDLGASIAQISNQMDVITANVTNMYLVVTNMGVQTAAIAGNVTNILSDVQVMQASLAALTNLSELITVLTNVDWTTLQNLAALSTGITNIQTAVTNLQATIRWGDVTNIAVGVNRLQTTVSWRDITNILVGVSNIQVNTMSLSGLTNLQGLATTFSNIDWSALSNINVLATGMTNILTYSSNTYARVSTFDLSGLSNITGLATAFSNVNWSSLSNIAVLATGLTNIETGVTNVEAMVGRLNLDALTNLPSLVSAVGKIDLSSLSNINTLATGLTNIQTGVTSLQNTVKWSDITNIANKVSGLDGVDWTQIQSTYASVSNLNATLSGVDWNALSQAGTRLQEMAGALGGVSNTVGQILQQTTPIKWQDITAILHAVSNMNVTVSGAALDKLPLMAQDITNMVTTLSAAGANLTKVASAMTNLQAQTYGMRWSDVTSLTSSVSKLQSQQQWSSVTNIMTTMQQVSTRLGATTDLAGTPTLFGGLAAVSNSLGQVGADAATARKKAQTASTAAQGAAGQISSLSDQVGQGRMDNALKILQDIKDSLYTVQKNVPEISNVSVTNLYSQMRDAAVGITKLGELEGVGDILQGLKDQKTPTGLDPVTILDMNKRMAEMQASMDLIRKLMDETANKPVYKDWLEGSQ